MVIRALDLVAKLQRGECESVFFTLALRFVHVDRSEPFPYQGRITFTREELDGVPEDVISGYTQRTEGDKVLYEATFRTPDIFPIVSFVFGQSTRAVES